MSGGAAGPVQAPTVIVELRSVVPPLPGEPDVNRDRLGDLFVSNRSIEGLGGRRCPIGGNGVGVERQPAGIAADVRCRPGVVADDPRQCRLARLHVADGIAREHRRRRHRNVPAQSSMTTGCVVGCGFGRRRGVDDAGSTTTSGTDDEVDDVDSGIDDVVVERRRRPAPTTRSSTTCPAPTTWSTTWSGTDDEFETTTWSTTWWSTTCPAPSWSTTWWSTTCPAPSTWSTTSWSRSTSPAPSTWSTTRARGRRVQHRRRGRRRRARGGRVQHRRRGRRRRSRCESGTVDVVDDVVEVDDVQHRRRGRRRRARGRRVQHRRRGRRRRARGGRVQHRRRGRRRRARGRRRGRRGINAPGVDEVLAGLPFPVASVVRPNPLAG